MRIPFTKMHGASNDFMVVRWPDGVPLPDAARRRAWADRRTGIGFDQMLVIEPRRSEGFDVYYRIFNADGGESEQCGNGVRCLAHFVTGGAAGELELDSLGGHVHAVVAADGRVSVELVEPAFWPEALPFTAAGHEHDPFVRDVAGQRVEFGVCSMGNPHAVIEVDSVETAAVGILGAALSAHSDFPRGVNVGFLEIQSTDSVRLRVYERGVGETPACGTGAAAAVAVARLRGRLGEAVDVHLPGGRLAVRWPGPGARLWQTGEAITVYEGEIEL